MEEENLSPWSVQSLTEELAVQQALQYVAEVPGGHLIGWCVGRVLHPDAELLKIAVRKKFRKSGIGGLLLQKLVDALQKRDITSLFLEVRTSNRAALGFYTKHGFLHVGSRPGYYTDPPDSAMILKKNLSW